MLISNDQAPKHWCPFARGLVELRSVNGNPVQVSNANRDAEGRPTTTCVGSACMAWRWAGWMVGPNGTPPIAPRPLDDMKVGPRLGYCGLAGEPFPAP